MAKYDPLHDHLAAARADRVELTFAQVERILGDELPRSARDHQAWWANEREGAHVQARAWLDAGYRVAAVDQVSLKVVFEREQG